MNQLRNDSVENDSVENDSVEEDSVENDSVEEELVGEDSVEEDSVENDSVEEDSVEDDKQRKWLKPAVIIATGALAVASFFAVRELVDEFNDEPVTSDIYINTGDDSVVNLECVNLGDVANADFDQDCDDDRRSSRDKVEKVAAEEESVDYSSDDSADEGISIVIGDNSVVNLECVNLGDVADDADFQQDCDDDRRSSRDKVAAEEESVDYSSDDSADEGISIVIGDDSIVNLECVNLGDVADDADFKQDCDDDEVQPKPAVKPEPAVKLESKVQSDPEDEVWYTEAGEVVDEADSAVSSNATDNLSPLTPSGR